LKKFHKKEIYTIQQFQYKKEPKYKWILVYFKKIKIDEWDSFCEECIMSYSKKVKIDEWDSFCEECIMSYSKKVDDVWNKQKSQVI